MVSDSLPSRLTLLVTVAIVAAIGAAVGFAGRESGSATPVPRPGSLPLLPGSGTFTTAIPARWQLSMTLPSAGATDYQLTDSLSGIPYGAVLPPPGTIEVQVVDLTPASVPQVLGPDAASQTPIQLLRYGYLPRGSQDVVRSVLPYRATLGGLPAAGDSFTYTYKGRRDVQSQVVSRKAGEIVSIQMDAAPSLEAHATAVLNTITARWHWLTPSAAPAPISPPPLGAYTPPPAGQWLTSGFTDAVVGNIANAHLDQPQVRAWYFARACTTPTRCHTELVDQLMDGTTVHAKLVRKPNSWWTVVFPATGGWCARVPSHPARRKETISDTIDLGWLKPGHQLVANETETITGCGDPTPSTVGYHWFATPVPQPTAPRISLNHAHATTAAAFRSAAARICTRVNAHVVPLAARIAAAERTLRSTASRGAKAAAEESIAKQLGALAPLSVVQHTQIPQPPTGPLDVLWLRDISESREQLGPGAAAITALQAAAIATSRYLRTGNPLELQRVVAQGTLYVEDANQLAGPARATNAIEQKLRLPAICISPPAIASIFTSPNVV